MSSMASVRTEPNRQMRVLESGMYRMRSEIFDPSFEREP